MMVTSASARRRFTLAAVFGDDMAVGHSFGRGEMGQAIPPTSRTLQGADEYSASWVGDFLFAGSSALLLLCANLFPDYWFFSFIALIPLFRRILMAEPDRALRLGFLFGLSFFGVSLINLCLVAPFAALVKIACGTALFAGFGWAVSWGRRRWGFNPLIVALLWIALELVIIRLGFSGGLLVGESAARPAFGGMATLFGFLSISFLIVLLNSIFIYALEAVATLVTAREIAIARGERKWDLLLTPGPITYQPYLIPLGRGPPLQ